jgi:hypothetical protein
MLFKIFSSWFFILMCCVVAFVGVLLIKSQAPEYQGGKSEIGYYLLGVVILAMCISFVSTIVKLIGTLPENGHKKAKDTIQETKEQKLTPRA